MVRVWFCNRRQKEKRINPPSSLHMSGPPPSNPALSIVTSPGGHATSATQLVSPTSLVNAVMTVSAAASTPATSASTNTSSTAQNHSTVLPSITAAAAASTASLTGGATSTAGTHKLLTSGQVSVGSAGLTSADISMLPNTLGLTSAQMASFASALRATPSGIVLSNIPGSVANNQAASQAVTVSSSAENSHDS